MIEKCLGNPLRHKCACKAFFYRLNIACKYMSFVSGKKKTKEF